MSNTTHKKIGLAGLSLGALGIVYGDIGTSPLYAVNEIFFGHAKLAQTKDNILGVVSLLLWSLFIVIAIKYMVFVLRADNNKEGGVFALYGHLKNHRSKKGVGTILFLLVLAAGFLYGEGLITPAISVLSATEGLKIVNPGFEKFIIPLTLVILTGLFSIQKKGTEKVGKVFGPIMMTWFLVIGFLGLRSALQSPEVFQALNPLRAISFVAGTNIHRLLVVLGSVILVITGGEAVFADMGHFGKKPIRLSWFSIVMPMLLLNYLGQGAVLLSGQQISGDNVFYSLVPSFALIPMVILATLATIIASQALISGAFSLTSQAIALNLLPKFKQEHTSQQHQGQIYLGFVNWSLYIGCVLIVLAFKSSGALAAAYGLAVSVVMTVGSLAMIFMSRLLWKWSVLKTLLIWAPLITIDAMFFAANTLKFLNGGFVPLVIGLILCFVMTTWLWGRGTVLQAYTKYRRSTVGDMMSHMSHDTTHFPKSLLVLTSTPLKEEGDLVPTQLQLFFDKFGILPRHVIVLTTTRLNQSHAQEGKHFVTKLFVNNSQRSFIAIQAKYGYMEEIDVSHIIKQIGKNEELFPEDDLSEWIILAGRERLFRSGKKLSRFNRLRFRVFSILNRSSLPSYEFYGLGQDLRLVIENIPVSI
jgi:KUP system potassium uptake protein